MISITKRLYEVTKQYFILAKRENEQSLLLVNDNQILDFVNARTQNQLKKVQIHFTISPSNRVGHYCGNTESK